MQQQAARCMKILSDLITKADAVWQMGLLLQMKRIGMRYREELYKYRSQIEGLKESPQSGMAEVVQGIINFLEGRR